MLTSPTGLLRAEGIAPPLARVGDKRPASPTDILDRTLVDENNDEEGVEIKQLEVDPLDSSISVH
jgi:hypothetical protein